MIAAVHQTSALVDQMKLTQEETMLQYKAAIVSGWQGSMVHVFLVDPHGQEN